MQHAGLRNRNRARALSRFRHLYCGQEWIIYFSFVLLRSLTRKNISLLVLLLVFRDPDEAGEKNTKRGSFPLALPQRPHPLARPHSRWPPAKWCNDETSARLVVKETRKPEMRTCRRARAVGGRVGVTGPDREEVGRSWQGRVVAPAGWSLESRMPGPARLSAPRAKARQAAARLRGPRSRRPWEPPGGSSCGR